MKEYIEKAAARDLMEQALEDDWEIQYADDRLDEIPTVDAVPVVRCRECILHDSCYTEDVFKFARLNDDSRFCGVGERKEVKHHEPIHPGGLA